MSGEARRGPGRPPQRFALRRVRLVGFHNFVDETVEVRDGGHLFLLGDNGSGKTTLLDAVQYALSGGQGLELNAAARVGGRRDDGRSIQGVVLRYDAERGVRNDGGAVAYVALELADGERGEPLCLGVGTEATSMEARVTRWGFLARTHLEQLPLVRADRSVTPREELRDRLGKEHVYGRMEDYRRAVADRLFGGPGTYEEVCRFWGMAKAYREIVAGARDFGALFTRLLPAPEPQVFGDILARLREIDDLALRLREIEEQRDYVAGLVDLEDEVAGQRETAARYAWLLAFRRLDEVRAEQGRARGALAELEDVRARACVDRDTGEAALRVAEQELRAAESAEGAQLLAAIDEARTRAAAATITRRTAAERLAQARHAEERARATAEAARDALAAALERAAVALANAAAALPAPEARALGDAGERLGAVGVAMRRGDALPADLPHVDAAVAASLHALRGRTALARDAAVATAARLGAEAGRARAEIAALEAEREEMPRLPGWSTLRATLAAEGLPALPLYQALEPRRDAAHDRVAAVEAMAGDEGLGLLLVPEPARAAVQERALSLAPTVRVQHEVAGDARLPAWVDELFEPGYEDARAALATVLSQSASLAEPAAPGAGGALTHRGARFAAGAPGARLLGAAARRQAHAARLDAARSQLDRLDQAVAAAEAERGRHDTTLAAVDGALTALAAAVGGELGRRHVEAHSGAERAAQASATRAHAEDEHATATARLERELELVATLEARAKAAGSSDVAARLQRLGAALDAARRAQRQLVERAALLDGEVARAQRELETLGVLIRDREQELAAAAGVLVARLLAPLPDEPGALERYVRETRRGDQFRSTAAVEKALREAENAELQAATELAGDGARGVRLPRHYPRFAFAYDREANRIVGRLEQPARTVLAGIDRDLAEQREVVTAKNRELMETLVMGSLARHLQDQVERLARMVRDINRLLADLSFGGSVYRFEVVPRADRREAVELVRRVALVDEDSRRRFRAWIEERLPDLKAGDGEVPEVLDYRRWYDYRLYVRRGEGDGVELTAERRRVGSGGEQGVPNYLLVLALGKLMFDNADARVRPLLFDEAFYGIDAGRRDQLLRFATALGLQLVVASPDQDGVTPAVQYATTLFVVKDEHGDVHLAPYHYWNLPAGAQPGLFGEGGASVSDPAAAECRLER